MIVEILGRSNLDHHVLKHAMRASIIEHKLIHLIRIDVLLTDLKDTSMTISQIEILNAITFEFTVEESI